MRNSLDRLAVLSMLMLSHGFVHATDLYVDTSQEDEVVISSQSLESENVIRIEDDIAYERDIQSAADTRQLPFNTEVVAAAKATTLDPALIHAVIAVESRHNPKAMSNKGAYGLMQLMPETARRFNALNKRDYKQNILAGAQYLRELLGLFGGNLELALAAYNAGPAAVQKYHNQIPPYVETKLYVPKVLKFYKRFAA
jgi:soluble lytic murein transglycosylase-like protein